MAPDSLGIRSSLPATGRRLVNVSRCNCPGRSIAPRSGEGQPKASHLRALKTHDRRTAEPPLALYGRKHARLGIDHGFLLLRRKLQCTPLLVWIAKGREYLPTHAEVRMAHVAYFARLRHAERHTAKRLGSHRDLVCTSRLTGFVALSPRSRPSSASAPVAHATPERTSSTARRPPRLFAGAGAPAAVPP